MSASSNPRLPSGLSNEIRLILLGKTGAGKSSFGNTILGNDLFHEESSPNSITQQCSISSRLFNEKEIFVVDTPGFIDTKEKKDKTKEEEAAIKNDIATSYQMTAQPGPHAFLLTIAPTKFTAQENEAIKYLDKIFGPEAVHHTIIVFTHSDSLRNITIKQYLDKLTPDAPLRDLLNRCKQRYITVNNWGTQQEKDQAVEKLVDMISTLTGVYRNEDFDEINKAILEEKSKGTYQPFKPDGTFNLLPQTKKIIIDRRFGANQRRGLKS